MFDYPKQLEPAMERGDERRALIDILDGPPAATEINFRTEEELMQAHGFPEYQLHASWRRTLLDDLKTFIENFDYGDEDKNRKNIAFAEDWLETHILGADRKVRLVFKRARSGMSVTPRAPGEKRECIRSFTR